MEEKKYYYRLASPVYIEQADKAFNSDLAKQVSGEFEKDHFHHIYQLGFPGEILQAAGFPDDKIEMSSVQLRNKSIDPNHPFDIKALKGLVSSLNDPIAVFVYGSKAKSLNVIIEQEYNDKKFLIGVHFNQEYRGTRISDIRGIHPRDTPEILNWIQQGKLEYVDKDKIQSLIAKQRINPAEVSHLDLDFVAKIIRNFENPKFSMENVTIMEDYFDEGKCHVATAEDSIQGRLWKGKLDVAGIGVGSRFRIERMCSFNDMQVKSIDYEKGSMTFFHPTTHRDYQGEFDWPIDRVLENIKLYQGSRWIQVDDNRKEIIIPEAKTALIERAKDKSKNAAFTDEQIIALNRYATLFSDKMPNESIFTNLIDGMRDNFRSEKIPEAWVKDMRDEAIALANGERRNQQNIGLSR
jgi:hypothetical protein